MLISITSLNPSGTLLGIGSDSKTTPVVQYRLAVVENVAATSCEIELLQMTCSNGSVYNFPAGNTVLNNGSVWLPLPQSIISWPSGYNYSFTFRADAPSCCNKFELIHKSYKNTIFSNDPHGDGRLYTTSITIEEWDFDPVILRVTPL